MDKKREELIKETTQKLGQLSELEQAEQLLKNNFTEFEYGGKTYRVHRPNAIDKEAIAKKRMEKYVEFLQNPNYLFRKQLQMLLENKGVNITAMEQLAQTMYNEEKELLKRLANTTTEPDITTLKTQIEDVRIAQKANFIEKEELLKYCIEKQLEDVVRFYLLFLVLEVKNGETWEKLYKTYEDFEKSDEDILLGRAAGILAVLLYNDSL
jgi:hypothetical protein